MATWESQTASDAAARLVLSPSTRVIWLEKARNSSASLDLSRHRPRIEAWNVFRITWAMRVASLLVILVMAMVEMDLANGVWQNERKQVRDGVTCLGPQSPFAAHGVYMGIYMIAISVTVAPTSPSNLAVAPTDHSSH